MSQPKNSTAPVAAQGLVTSERFFANMRNGELLRVNEGLPAADALLLAKNLAHGLMCLHEHLGVLVDHGEELTYLDEQRALAFLAESVGALIGSAEVSLRRAVGGDQ